MAEKCTPLCGATADLEIRSGSGSLPGIEGSRLHLQGRAWEISRALAGEWVRIERLDGRVLVYYCRSLVRELDLVTQRSTAVDRWVS